MALEKPGKLREFLLLYFVATLKNMAWNGANGRLVGNLFPVLAVAPFFLINHVRLVKLYPPYISPSVLGKQLRIWIKHKRHSPTLLSR